MVAIPSPSKYMMSNDAIPRLTFEFLTGAWSFSRPPALWEPRKLTSRERRGEVIMPGMVSPA